MTITLLDMRDALKGQSKADVAIFWFCHAWHSGKDSDLYRIMKQINFYPRWLNPGDHFLRILKNSNGEPKLKAKLHADDPDEYETEHDPEILYCWDVLGKMWEKAFGPPVQYKTQPVKFADIEEGDILIHTSPRTFPCIEAAWPCRVYKWHGDLGVSCAEGPSGASFHPLKMDERGYVVGFVR